MALSDFWELKDNQILSGKAILNVYHLKRISGGASAVDVANAFTNTVLVSAFLDMQDDNLTRTTIEVRNLGTPTDFVALDSSGFPGTDTADHGPVFNVASIQFNRTRTDMKNGQKRFTVGNDNDQSDGVWDATMISEIQALGTTIHNPWQTAAAPAVDVCSFVILKRFCIVPGQDPCKAYRLPDNTEIDDWHYVPTSKIVRSRIRSQVSRKVL